MYKDMVALLQTGDLCTTMDLKISNEDSFLGDKHIDFLELEANRVFRQGREFQSNRHLVQYFFTNRGMREDLEKTCLLMEATDERPDVVIINSAIWDMSRYPPNLDFQLSKNQTALAEEINVSAEYFNRVAMICRRLRVLLPPSSTVVWVIMPPSSTPETDKTGFLSLNRLTFDQIRMRLLEANVRVAQIVREAGFDVLDLSFHFRLSSFQVFRIKDGVHFNTIATRFMNQLVLGHLATAWDMEQSVLQKWPQKLIDITSSEKNQRTEFFTAALKALTDFNEEKFANETIHQELRSQLFKDYSLPHKEETGIQPLTPPTPPTPPTTSASESPSEETPDPSPTVDIPVDTPVGTPVDAPVDTSVDTPDQQQTPTTSTDELAVFNPSEPVVMEKIDQNLRFLLMVMKYMENTESVSQNYTKAFQESTVPEEFVQFNEEDIERLEIILKQCQTWIGHLPPLLVAVNNKRPLIEPARPALLPTPPDLPPGVGAEDDDIIVILSSDSGSDMTTSPASNGSASDSPNGIPNRIADAEPLPPKKKARYVSPKN
uniref:SGNH_hydro domain-containing protein n=2 Tax=Caenorhabditis tropicalis TaxID=1561998 RepID=A0A1I7UZW5_9PELO